MHLSIKQYLDKLAEMVDDSYGKQVRECFKDIKGSSELGMLASPSGEELEQLKTQIEEKN